MGQAKQEQIEHQEKVQRAVGLCLKIGALQECPIHSDIYINTLEFQDPDELYEEVIKEVFDALASFDDAGEMKNCLWEAMEEAAEECPICAKNMED